MSTCKILLADSNIGDQYLLKELVHQLDRNWAVNVVPSGRHALRYLHHLTRTEYPQVILIDYAVPVRGALELLEWLMNDSRYHHIPKYVWSSVVVPEGIEPYLHSGARGVLPKPQKASEAKALVRQLLSGC